MYHVGIFLFNDIELLDFAGPYEVFSVASELNNYALFKVFTVAQNKGEIQSVNGLKIIPDFSFIDHPDIDLLIIPGGVGTKSEMLKKDVLHWLSQTHQNSEITMSVCSGARLLGSLGLLDGVECTTHHEVAEHLQEIAPQAIINKEKRYTHAGISSGIDLSLHIVEKLFGEEVAKNTKIYMEYGDWDI